jgi:hypothetical protein
MPAPCPGDPDYPDDELPLTRENVEREADRLRGTMSERKARKAALLGALKLAEVDGNAWDDALRFEIRRNDE